MSLAVPHNQPDTGLHLCASNLLVLAAVEADKCHATKVTLNANNSQVMAAVAAEGFIDEFAYMLLRLEPSGKAPELVKIGLILQMLEESRVQVTEKFQIASQLLPGEPFDAGKEPFGSFRQLIKLRNSLVHPKLASKPPGWFAYFVSNGLIVKVSGVQESTFDWKMQLQSRKCAKWACQSTARIVLDLIERTRAVCDERDVPGLYHTLAQQWEWTRTEFGIWNE